MTEKEIRDNAKLAHDTLSESYYSGKSKLTKDQFDLQHGQVWNGMDAELLVGGYITLPKPGRNLEAEIDEIKAQLLVVK